MAKKSFIGIAEAITLVRDIHNHLTGTEKLVLVLGYISRLGTESSNVFPSDFRVAINSGVSERVVHTVKAALIARGVLLETKKGVFNQWGGGNSTHVDINVPLLRQWAAEDRPKIEDAIVNHRAAEAARKALWRAKKREKQEVLTAESAVSNEGHVPADSVSADGRICCPVPANSASADGTTCRRSSPNEAIHISSPYEATVEATVCTVLSDVSKPDGKPQDIPKGTYSPTSVARPEPSNPTGRLASPLPHGKASVASDVPVGIDQEISKLRQEIALFNGEQRRIYRGEMIYRCNFEQRLKALTAAQGLENDGVKSEETGSHVQC